MEQTNQSDPIRYRIINANNTIHNAGTGLPSWFTLEQAKKIVNSQVGQMIYEYWNGERLHEVL